MNKDQRAKIILVDSPEESQLGNLSYLKINNIDFENNGRVVMNDVEMENTGYINEKGGVTNIEGSFTTDSSIVNKGTFNVAKSGKINIFKKFRENHPFWFWISNVGIFLGIIYNIIELIKFFGSN